MTIDFKNSIILPNNLPELKKEEFNLVDPKYLRLIYIRLAIFVLIMILLGVGFFFIAKSEIPPIAFFILAGVLLSIFTYAFIITRLSFPYRGYLIREKDIAYKRGLINFKLTSIPFKRIQHVELIQGILEKKMELASIKVYTAGGSTDDLSIPGLPLDTAQQIRSFLTDEISSDEQN